MEGDKPLTVRDYLESRSAKAAGSMPRRASRQRLGSFKDMLRTQQSRQADKAAAGKRITDYRRTSVSISAAARAPRPAGISETAATPPATQGSATAPALQRELPPTAGAKMPDSRLHSRLSAGQLQALNAQKVSAPHIEQSIQTAARRYDLSPELIRSVIRVESDFQPNAVSAAGAMGLMQLMPQTARELGVSNPFNVHQNIDGGARYLRQMLDRFGGDLKLALAAYNAGPGAVEQSDRKIPNYPETRQYVRQVLRHAGLTGAVAASRQEAASRPAEGTDGADAVSSLS